MKTALGNQSNSKVFCSANEFIASNKLIQVVQLSLADDCLDHKMQHDNMLGDTLGLLKYSEQIICLEGIGLSFTFKYQTNKTWSEIKENPSIHKAA